MRCPRCHREVAHRTAFCPGCGAPLALGDEPAPRKLDQTLDIDRRTVDPPEPRSAPEVPPAGARPEPAAAPHDAAPPPRGALAPAEPAPGPGRENAAAARAEPAPGPREPIPPAARAEPAPGPRKAIPPAARAEPAPGPRKAIPPAARAEPAPGPRKEIPPCPAEPAPAVSPLERSSWDLGAAARPSAGAIRADATGPVEIGSRRPRPDGTAAAPGRPGAGPGGAREIHLRRPEDWRRAVAWGIDAGPFLVGALALVRLFVREAGTGVSPGIGVLDLLDLVARERVIVLSVAAAAALAFLVYATLAHALAGATLGKRLVRLRVVTGDGARPTLGRSAARSALAALSGALLGLGLLLALFTRSGRALHDLLARTWVVEVP